MREIVSTEKAPQAIGPYSQAIVCSTGKMIYTSGQIPLNPNTMELVSEDVTLQTRQVMENLQAVLAKAGCSLANVVKTTVYLKNMDDFQTVNAEYARFFANEPPARSAVEVARLPRDVKVEIEAVAILEA